MKALRKPGLIRRSFATMALMLAGALMAGPGGTDTDPAGKRARTARPVTTPGADRFFSPNTTWSPQRHEARVIPANRAVSALRTPHAAQTTQDIAPPHTPGGEAEYISFVAEKSLGTEGEKFKTLAIGQDNEKNTYLASSQEGKFPSATEQWLKDNYDGRYGPLYLVDNKDLIDGSFRNVTHRHAEISMLQYVEAADRSDAPNTDGSGGAAGDAHDAALGLLALNEPRKRTLAWVAASKPCCPECAHVLDDRGTEIRGLRKADEALSKHASAPLISGDLMDPALDAWGGATIFRKSQAAFKAAAQDARSVPVLAPSSPDRRAGRTQHPDAAAEQTKETDKTASRKRARPPAPDQ